MASRSPISTRIWRARSSTCEGRASGFPRPNAREARCAAPGLFACRPSGQKKCRVRRPGSYLILPHRGEITFQRGTAGRITRRWEEVATKQTNSLLLICSAQRAYARSTRADLLCKFVMAQPSACEIRRNRRISCLRRRRYARPLGTVLVCRSATGSNTDEATAADCLSVRQRRACIPCRQPGARDEIRLAIPAAARPPLPDGRRGGRRGGLNRSSARPWPAGSRGTRRCARCSSARTGRRNRCRSSALPPRAEAARGRNCPR